MAFTIALVGRPNVGKSTLFNRLVGAKLALVDDTPGVTRDRKEGEGRLGDLRFRVIDTAGLEEADDAALESRMRRQTEAAVRQSDAVLFLIDARAGLTPVDRHFAAWLRRFDKPVILLANKCEARAAEPGRMEAYELGLGDPLPISAEHGQGLGELFDALAPLAPEAEAEAGNEPPASEDDDGVLQLAIVGRPNVGKSTLVNRLTGAKVSIVSPKVQTTRARVLGIRIVGDAQIAFVDTPGLFRPRRRLDRAMIAAAWGGAEDADVVALLADASAKGDDGTDAIVEKLKESGRTDAVLVLNKIDVADKPKLLALADRLHRTGVFSDVFMVSARTGDGIEDLLALLAKRMPEGPWLFPEDQVSDMPERMLAAEIVREQLYLQLHQELPYRATVETEQWKDLDDGSVRIE